jgi:cytochrome b6-f complex iron-sulfur subunit
MSLVTMSQPKLERRSLLKVLCASTGALCSGALGACGSEPATGGTGTPVYVNLPAVVSGTVTLALDDYPQLKKDGGGMVGRATGMDDPLAVVRIDEATYMAMPGICTHMACPLKFNSLNATLDCVCHGSSFELDGTVINGPATKALTSYETKLEGNSLRIRITVG